MQLTSSKERIVTAMAIGGSGILLAGLFADTSGILVAMVAIWLYTSWRTGLAVLLIGCLLTATIILSPANFGDDEPVRVVRSAEAGREAVVRLVILEDVDEVAALLIQVAAVGRREAHPAAREDADAAEELHGVVRERVRRPGDGLPADGWPGPADDAAHRRPDQW